MPSSRVLVLTVAASVAFPFFVTDRDGAVARAATGADRGKYLVEGVGVCWTCHTPRDESGAPDHGRWLLGGPVPYAPARPTEGWADVAPRIAGLPPGTDEQFIRLMMTGISRTGNPPRQPMPQFRFTRSDAAAVLAYLKSIKSAE